VFFCCYRAKRTMFPVPALDLALVLPLVPVPDPALIPAPSIAQKRKASWRVMALAASDGQIGHMGFLHDRPLQLLSSRQLDFSCPKKAIIGLLRFVN
jgi:hypothetical protein